MRAEFDVSWRREALAGEATAVRRLAEAALRPLYHFCAAVPEENGKKSERSGPGGLPSCR